MKKLAILLAIVTATLSACAQSVETQVSGQLEGLGDSLLYNLDDANEDSPRTKGVIPVKNGKFEFSIQVVHPASLVIMDLKKIQAGDPTDIKVAYCTLVPGENVTFTGALGDFKVSGAKIYEEMNEAQECVTAPLKNIPQENRDSVRKVYTDNVLAYIKAHPNQEAAMVLVTDLDYDNLKKAVNLFSPAVREGRMAGLWKTVAKAYEAQAKRKAAAEKVVEGTMAQDFTLPDLNGKPLTLSTLRGKYVILDFWGSWCGWCIKGMPEMKKYYEKYNGKFEILGVDCEDTPEKWKAAVEKHQLPWKHVRQSKETQNVSDNYGIQGFPTKIVIDPQGKIAKIVIGEDPSFYEYLDQLFSGK